MRPATYGLDQEISVCGGILMPAIPFSIITPIWPWEQFQALIPHPLNHHVSIRGFGTRLWGGGGPVGLRRVGGYGDR